MTISIVQMFFKNITSVDFSRIDLVKKFENTIRLSMVEFQLLFCFCQVLVYPAILIA